MAPAAVRVTSEPMQMAGAAGKIVITGSGCTVIVDIAVLVQWLASVPVTVYTVLTAGAAVMVAPVVNCQARSGQPGVRYGAGQR